MGAHERTVVDDEIIILGVCGCPLNSWAHKDWSWLLDEWWHVVVVVVAVVWDDDPREKIQYFCSKIFLSSFIIRLFQDASPEYNGG